MFLFVYSASRSEDIRATGRHHNCKVSQWVSKP